MTVKLGEKLKYDMADVPAETLTYFRGKLAAYRAQLIEEHLVNISNADLDNFQKGQIWVFTQLIEEIDNVKKESKGE